MSIFALTGGIGSGKSAAATQFAKLGIPIIDTDVIAHQITAAGQPAIDQIRQTFGDAFIHATGELNRPHMRAHVFNNTDARKTLEAILHPRIRAEVLQQLEHNQQLLAKNPHLFAYQIVVVPILFENNQFQHIAKRTIVVDCEEQLQISRAMARSQLSEDTVRAIMQAQVPRATRLKLADEVIENNGTIENLIQNVNNMHKKLSQTC